MKTVGAFKNSVVHDQTSRLEFTCGENVIELYVLVILFCNY